MYYAAQENINKSGFTFLAFFYYLIYISKVSADLKRNNKSNIIPLFHETFVEHLQEFASFNLV
jgi:hypothetical protein